MLEELELLIRLQEIDSQFMELEADRGDLPEQIRQITTEIEKFKSALDRMRRELEDVEQQRRQHQRLVEEARDRLKKSQSAIHSIKTTREYDALSAEIEKSKSQIAVSEKAIVELSAKLEQIHTAMDAEKVKLAQLEQEHTERQAEMHERFDSSQELEIKLRQERERIVGRLTRPVIAHYERIRNLRDGIGVSHLESGACSYCFSKIPPQRQAEIRRMNDIILCETCGCILVSDRR